MSHGTFLGSVMEAVLKPFGIESHYETFNDIQISELITPGKAEQFARKNAKQLAKGNSQQYFQIFRAFQRDYRKKYSAQFMQRQGYAPSSTAETRVATKAKTEVYLEGLYGYADVTVSEVKDKYLTVQEKGQHAIQTLVGYEWSTGNIITSGKTYILVGYTEDTIDETVLVHTRMAPIEDIVQNLTDNYSYDGTNVVVEGETYLVGAIQDGLNVDDQYETVCTHATLPDVIIYTQADRVVHEVTNAAYGTEASRAVYVVNSGEVGTETRYWIKLANTADIYERVNLDITAIIPMKENNAMVDLEGTKLNRMLRKLNLSGDQLEASLDNSKMDGAYLLTGIDPTYDDDITNKVLFNMFDYIAAGDGSITVDISELEMKYKFTLQKRTVQGVIGPVGTVTRSQTGTGASVIMTLRVQQDSNEYKEIVVSEFVQGYVISNQAMIAYLDNGSGKCRLVIPLDLLNSLRYKEFVWIYERSLCMLAFSTETVFIEWYETAAFATLLQIVIIVIVIITLIPSGGASIEWGKVALAMVKAMAVMYIGQEIAAAIGGTLGAIIGAVVVIVGMTMGPGAIDVGSAEMWLLVADQSIGVMSQMIEHKMNELMAMSAEFFDTMQAKMEELEEAAEKYEDYTDVDWYALSFESNYAGKKVVVYKSIEEYCNSIVGNTDLSDLVDYGAQIDYNIRTRNSIVAGTG